MHRTLAKSAPTLVTTFVPMSELPPMRSGTDCSGVASDDPIRSGSARDTTSLFRSHLDATVSLGVALDDESTQPIAARMLEAGTIVRHRYVLEHIIGWGGDSMVFRARDLHRAVPGETVEGLIALKVLLPERRFDPLALRRLKRSFIQMQRLTHPRIARVLDLDSDGDIWFMSMAAHYRARHKGMDAGGRESYAQRLKILGACCEALEYAHSMGIIHGDLKPSNVMVTQDGDTEIDFGSARTPELVLTPEQT